MSRSADPDRERKVFVVHGRNPVARAAMFAFLRSIGLTPIEWSHARALAGEANPYIGQILDAAFDAAQAVVVLLTPDEIVFLRPEYASDPGDPETQPSTQARPNVLFEAGIAMGRDSRRTVLVELGSMRNFSDIAGRHVLRISNSAQHRQELAERLRTAGCTVDTSGSDWYESGDFSPPAEPTIEKGPPPSVSSILAPAASSLDDWTSSGNFSLRIGEAKSAGFGMYSVDGEAINNGPRVHIAMITATFRGPNDNIVGTARGAVSQIDSSEKKTFTLSSHDDLSSYARSQVQVDNAV